MTGTSPVAAEDSVTRKHTVIRKNTLTDRPLAHVVYASLSAALITVGAYVAVPIGPVPIVLQNLFVLLAGLLLGARWGAASVLLYLGLGTVGFPVFAGGTGGPAHLAGPTGGYLLGYVPAVAVTGLISRVRPADRHGKSPALWPDAAAAVAGSAVVYACGASWLAVVTGMPPAGAVAAGVLPFLPGDVLKMAAAVAAARYLRPVIERRASGGGG